VVVVNSDVNGMACQIDGRLLSHGVFLMAVLHVQLTKASCQFCLHFSSHKIIHKSVT